MLLLHVILSHEIIRFNPSHWIIYMKSIMFEYLRDIYELEVQIYSKRVQQTQWDPCFCFCIFLLLGFS